MNFILLSIFSGLVSTPSSQAQESGAKISGKVLVDGSSTVFPVSEAIAEEFQKANGAVKVSVAASGTGGGFKKFCKAETDVSGASRPIEASEIEVCRQNKVEFVELPVAYDGIAVIVNKENTFAKSLTIAELKKIWEPGSQIKKWSEVRAGFPESPLSAYGPGPEHGTFDYFTQAINGKEKAIRSDFNAANPESLVTAVKGDKRAIAYVGYAYYVENKSKLNLVAVDAGKGAIVPDEKTITSGVYKPLSRPLFVYVSLKSLQRAEVKAFMRAYIQEATKIAPEVGYASLGSDTYSLVARRLSEVIPGTIYSSPESKNLTISELLTASAKKSGARKDH
jgi:phosphate transport system substrate-binding protein